MKGLSILVVKSPGSILVALRARDAPLAATATLPAAIARIRPPKIAFLPARMRSTPCRLQTVPAVVGSGDETAMKVGPWRPRPRPRPRPRAYGRVLTVARPKSAGVAE